MRIVVALGGNAVSRPGEEGNIAQQFAHARQSVRPLADLLLAGHELAITHGNGPQVGSIMRRVELARRTVYPLPLDIAVADTQAGMGYMIGQCLTNELASRGRPRSCVTIVTTVRVDPADPAFARPTKPIGHFMSQIDAEDHARQDGWTVAEDAGRGWRRVVASPAPLEILELPVIRRLVDAGETVVACGGGGVPVTRDAGGRLTGCDAVIDKDRTSLLLALGIDADLLAILTDVPRVDLNYGTPHARPIDRTTVSEARRWLSEGQFPAGSMAPKIEAAADFVERSQRPSAQAIITSSEAMRDALAGRGGTHILRDGAATPT